MKKEFDSTEPILSLCEITKRDETFPFVKIKGGKPTEITIEDLQEDVAKIQLKTEVPEAPRKVFTVCKKLYVFGYFYYPFFTVSQHYAFLTLESAMRNKYREIYGKDWRWRTTKEGVRKEEYYGLPKVRRGLIEAKVIPKEKEDLYDIGGGMRNLLSHLTKMPTLLPDPDILKKKWQNWLTLFIDKSVLIMQSGTDGKLVPLPYYTSSVPYDLQTTFIKHFSNPVVVYYFVFSSTINFGIMHLTNPNNVL